MEFRNANGSDDAHIVDMVNALISELGGENLDVVAAAEACRNLLADPDRGAVLVAVDENGPVVGVCCISYQTAIRTVGRYAIVQEMFVSPEHRDQNVGAALLHRAVESASDAGCRVIELGTPPHGDRQEKFYRKEGFDVVGLRMRKVLSG